MLILALLACAEPQSEDVLDVLDVRVTVPDDGDVQIATPEFEIAPYTEQQMCSFATWTGGDVAVARAITRQDPDWGHHALLFSTSMSADTHPDGSIIDCTVADDALMISMLPLEIPTGPIVDGVQAMDLPAGMASRLADGTRLIVQSHYVNSGPDPILGRDVVSLTTLPIEQVETWVSTFAQAEVRLALAPQKITTVEAGCTFDQGAEVLTMFGHMHEHGAAFAADRVDVDGARERIYEVPEWDASFRDAPPIAQLGAGELIVEPGDRFEFACTFDNDTDETLRFPNEMCAFVGLMYPAEAPVVCVP